jgi:hypothetical protein
VIDRDEDGYPISEPFYAEALPCESCGHPTHLARVWNAEHELWIAIDCSCNAAPDVPLPACMIQVMEAAQTVGELCDSVKAHLRICPVCSPSLLPERKPVESETEAARRKREAA